MSSLILSANLSKGSKNFHTHFHDCNQMLIIQEGLAKITIDEKSYTLTPGSLVLISRFEQHSITPLTKNYNRYILRISSSSISSDETENLLFSLLVNRPENFSHIIDITGQLDEYIQILDAIIDEISDKKEFGDYLVDKLLYRLLAILYRNNNSVFSANHTKHIEIISSIKNELSLNYNKSYTLDALAESYHISPSYLSHIFKKTTGVSLMNYLQACRIASAKKLLATTDISVSEIVELCGFSDHSNFSRIFKIKNGITPVSFRSIWKNIK